MSDHPELSDAEWTIVLELLERERSELHPEIRHTRTRALREELQLRLERVNGLCERLRPAVEAAVG